MTSTPETFEKLAAKAKTTLERALHGQLDRMTRSDLTLLRLELDTVKRMQPIVGQVAPWAEWRAARERLQAEIDQRPAPTRRRRR
jgi:hypothetical protein